MASAREVVRAFNAGLFEPETIRSPDGSDGHFTAGQFEETSLAADQEGVLAEIEVGADTPLAGAEAVVVGQFLGSNPAVPRGTDVGDKFLAGNTRQARPVVDLETAADGEPSGQVRVAVKAASQPTSTGKPYQMKPRLESDLDVNASGVSITDIEPLTPQESMVNGELTYAGRGDFINVVVLQGSTGQQFGLDHSTIQLPVLVWDGRMD